MVPMVVTRFLASSSVLVGEVCQTASSWLEIDHIGDPVELAQVGLELRRHAERLIRRQALADYSDHRAVVRRDLRHVVGGGDAAAAGHVDDDHRGIAGNVLAHEAGDQPRILS